MSVNIIAKGASNVLSTAIQSVVGAAEHAVGYVGDLEATARGLPKDEGFINDTVLNRGLYKGDGFFVNDYLHKAIDADKKNGVANTEIVPVVNRSDD